MVDRQVNFVKNTEGRARFIHGSDSMKTSNLGATLFFPPHFEKLPVTLRERLTLDRFRVVRRNLPADFLNTSLCARIMAVREQSQSDGLKHRLSDVFVMRQLSEGRDIVAAAESALCEINRFAAEKAACHIACGYMHKSVLHGSSTTFNQLLAIVCSNATGINSTFRSTGVRLGKDAAGKYWQFPHAQLINSLLEKFRAEILVAYGHSPLLAAIIALVGVNAIHPFADGNGRTSRALFNAILITGGVLPQLIYVPLKHVYYIAKFGFELRLREAILFGDYVPIFSFFCDAMDLIDECHSQVYQYSKSDSLETI